jgi:hypothetical protein
LTATDDIQAGKAHFVEWRFDAAEAVLARALAADPHAFEAKAYLARTWHALGRTDDAIALFRDALEIEPGNAAVHLLLAQSLLTAGQYAEGWVEYKWRYKGEGGAPFPHIQAPLWDGSPLPNGTLLVFGEQGYGDVLQFVRLLPLARERCARLSFGCSPPLARLLDGIAGADHHFQDWHRVGSFAAYIPVSSLPGALGVTPENLPADVPYVQADPRGVRRWQRRLGAAAGPRIGICWAGRPTHPNDRFRSIPFDTLVDALPKGARLVSLQKGERAADAKGSRVLDLSDRLHDFADTAAVIDCLDMVVTVDTSVAHLAGAMGKPVHVLVPYLPDWRWGREGDRTPWYPTARLHRQPAPRDWKGAVSGLSALC